MDWLKYLLIPLTMSALITPILKMIAVKLEIYAQMNERTVHSGKIVRIGGVAIYVSFIVCMACFYEDRCNNQWNPHRWNHHVPWRTD